MKKPILITILIIVCCLALCAAAFAAGSSYTKQLTANYVGISLVVHGETVTPKDASGNIVDPFIVDGTTYLPVRAVAEALGEEVSWDGTTKTVYIGETPTDNPGQIPELTPQPTPQPTSEPKGELSLDNLQGVWYRNSIPPSNMTLEEEFIVDGRMFKYIWFAYDEHEYKGYILSERIIELDDNGILRCEIEQVELFNYKSYWSIGQNKEYELYNFTGISFCPWKNTPDAVYSIANQAVVEGKLRDRASGLAESATEYKEITLDNLQGVWYDASSNSSGQMCEYEIIISNNTYTSVYYNPEGDTYSYVKQTITGVDSSEGIIFFSDYEFQHFEASRGYEIIRMAGEDVTNSSYIGQESIRFFTGESMKTEYNSLVKRDKSTITDIVKTILEEKAIEDAEEKGRALDATEYTYLAGSDFRRVKRQYSQATPNIACVTAYTNLDGDTCVVTYVQYKIISNYSVVTLHNISTGDVREDPEGYYDTLISRAYGQTKLHYMDLQIEMLEHLTNAMQGIEGVYVSADELESME